MIRAAAKNFKFVTVITNPARYEEIAEKIRAEGAVDGMTRMQLAHEAFAHTADYDAAINAYLAQQLEK